MHPPARRAAARAAIDALDYLRLPPERKAHVSAAAQGDHQRQRGNGHAGVQGRLPPRVQAGPGGCRREPLKRQEAPSTSSVR